jgi:hypothetical protein
VRGDCRYTVGRSAPTVARHSISGSASRRKRTGWPTFTFADSVSSTSPLPSICEMSTTSTQASPAQQVSPIFFLSPRQLVLCTTRPLTGEVTVISSIPCSSRFTRSVARAWRSRR